MGFWKRNKSKVLIGGALLAMATSALTFVKSEENRLRKEIVGCERVIERETRDGGRPKELKRREILNQAIQQRQELQEEKQEVEVSEEEINKIIKDIDDASSYVYFYENRGRVLDYEKDLEEYEKNFEDFIYLLDYIKTIPPLQLEGWFDSKGMDSAWAKRTFNHYTLSNPFLVEALNDAYGRTITFHMYFAMNKRKNQDFNKDSYKDQLLSMLVKLFIRKIDLPTDFKEDKEEIEKYFGINKRLLEITSKSKKTAQELKYDTDEMNDVNEKLTKYEERINTILAKKEQLLKKLTQERDKRDIKNIEL